MEKTVSSKAVSLKIASELLRVKAIKLSAKNPFTWSSGWKSPIYCDNRIALSYPKTRSLIKKELVAAAKKYFLEVEAIAGVATAGIPQGALLADALDLPFVYVRDKPKGHGMENLIEGEIAKHTKVVLVEDLISTGGSSLKAAAALQKVDAEVIGMLAIFTYGFSIADKNFDEANISLHCLSNYSVMLEEALSQGYIQTDQLETLEEWRKSPETWGI